jgi:hypothetical protein
MPDTILDEIVRETERRRQGQSPSMSQRVGAMIERDRIAALAERVGPKGALAELLEEMRQFASSP